MKPNKRQRQKFGRMMRNAGGWREGRTRGHALSVLLRRARNKVARRTRRAQRARR